MKCPFCAHTENKVIDSRLSKDGAVIRRRRECNDCGRRFTSYERIEEIMPQIVKSDERREPFERNKILRALRIVCEKRSVAEATLEGIVDQLEKQLQETGEKEVESSVIAEEILIRLSELDDIAYLRYAARYRDFENLSEFVDDLSEYIQAKGGEDGFES